MNDDGYSNVGHDDTGVLDLILSKPVLLRWATVLPAPGTKTSFVPIEQVEWASVTGEVLMVQTRKNTFTTTDGDTIKRFFEQWEIV